MTTEELTPREMRLSTTVRGIVISVLIAGYALVFHQPRASFTTSLLIAAAVQLAVIVLRRIVPPASLPQAMYVFELLADGVTVLLFALGVYGGIRHVPDEF